MHPTLQAHRMNNKEIFCVGTDECLEDGSSRAPLGAVGVSTGIPLQGNVSH